MGTEATWNGDGERIQGLPPVRLGGRPRTVHWDVRLCLACGERRPLFFYRGVVKADRDHTLCFRCYRAEVNRLRARRFGAGPAAVSRGPRPSREVADRTAMLADLAARRRRAQIIARHALEAPEPLRAGDALAS